MPINKTFEVAKKNRLIRACFFCQEGSHFRSDCPKLNAIIEYNCQKYLEQKLSIKFRSKWVNRKCKKRRTIDESCEWNEYAYVCIAMLCMIIYAMYGAKEHNINIVVTDINNIESTTDFESSKEGYNINNNNNRNNIVNNNRISDRENRNINISDNENNSIVTNNVLNRSIDDYCINFSNFLNNECANIYGRDIIDLKYKKVWNVLFNNQIVFGDYSRTPSLVRSGTILRKIMTRASIRQGLLFQRYKCKLTRSVNAENVVRQASRFINSNTNLKPYILGSEIRCI
ncbi:hypothetical protein H8356DRAFT_1380959 [Neocallimastix lanati (nom. inval.)]|nr:hypothetical protein H8356DRAFT_1380959 [Neocallimastix sp. JGI-2020a]